MSRRRKPPEMYPHARDGWCVTLDGKRIYLGRDRARAEDRYRQILARWLLGSGAEPEDGRAPVPANDLLVSEAALVYSRHAQQTGVAESQHGRIRYALAGLVDRYGTTQAAEFDQLALARLRTWLTQQPDRRLPAPESGQRDTRPRLSRNYVNSLVGCVQTAWSWLASQKLVPVEAALALRTVKALRRGHGGRELEDVPPVAPDVVTATLAHCSSVIRAMVEVQQLTGMRPAEVCRMRPVDISRRPEDLVQPPAGPRVGALVEDGRLVWIYAPAAHKTMHRGKVRIVALGPRAQAVLTPFLERRDPAAHLFSPAEAVREQRAKQRANRKTRVQPTQADRRRSAPAKGPGLAYTPNSYRQAVQRAARKAGVEEWSPNQLRHWVATVTAEEHDFDTAAAVMGHERPDTTVIYVAQQLRKAARRAAKDG